MKKLIKTIMQTEMAALDIRNPFHRAAPSRFYSYGRMEWPRVERAELIRIWLDQLERLFEHGARDIKFWKDLGLNVRDNSGALLCADDERRTPLLDKATELSIPIMFHTTDPDAFLRPIARLNARYEKLATHPDWCIYGSPVFKAELIEQCNCIFARHPKTTFVGTPVAEGPENLASVAGFGHHPNLYLDIRVRMAELGGQPYTALTALIRGANRILFGIDLLPRLNTYSLYNRFLETVDEYLDARRSPRTKTARVILEAFCWTMFCANSTATMPSSFSNGVQHKFRDVWEFFHDRSTSLCFCLCPQ